MIRTAITPLLLFTTLFCSFKSISQHKPRYQWTTWHTFSAHKAIGKVGYNGKLVTVSMITDYAINSTGGIFGYPIFKSFDASIPNTFVPKTDWSDGKRGTTKFSFDTPVTDPVLLISSLGRNEVAATLRFSFPYVVIFEEGKMEYPNDKTITGMEGNAIIKFKGDVESIEVYSNTPEEYTNVTWGIDASDRKKQLSYPSPPHIATSVQSVKPSIPQVQAPDQNINNRDYSAKTDSSQTSIRTGNLTSEQLTRSTETIKILKVTSPTIVIDMYDNGEIDGDSISVYHNGVKIVSSQQLSTQKIQRIILAGKQDKLHEIVVVAENLGSIPPNTALLIITAGTSREELRTKTNTTKNQKIIIEYVD